MTAIQQCAAMILIRIGNAYEAFDQSDYDTATCGEPVAELGPCLVSGSAEYPDEWRCNWPPDEHNAAEHDYQGRLVHVTLGPCEECGHENCEDDECAACLGLIFKGQDKPENSPHESAPTVTERTMEHEAEVSDA